MKKTKSVRFANSTNWYLGKKKQISLKKENKQKQKTHVLLENNQESRMSSKKKKHWQIYLS